MKKIIGLSASILFLAFSIYSLTVLVVGTLWLRKGTTSPFPPELVMPIILVFLMIGGIVLCAINYKRFRIGRFNSDIFATIYLFLLFMLTYTVSNTLVLNYAFFADWFPLIWPVMFKFSINGIGVYEATMFMATLCCGLTIGEDKNKKYYE